MSKTKRIQQSEALPKDIEEARIFRQGNKLVYVNADGTYTSVNTYNEEFDLEKGVAILLLKAHNIGGSTFKKICDKVEVQGGYEDGFDEDEFDESLKELHDLFFSTDNNVFNLLIGE